MDAPKQSGLPYAPMFGTRTRPTIASSVAGQIDRKRGRRLLPKRTTSSTAAANQLPRHHDRRRLPNRGMKLTRADMLD